VPLLTAAATGPSPRVCPPP